MHYFTVKRHLDDHKIDNLTPCLVKDNVIASRDQRLSLIAVYVRPANLERTGLVHWKRCLVILPFFRSLPTTLTSTNWIQATVRLFIDTLHKLMEYTHEVVSVPDSMNAETYFKVWLKFSPQPFRFPRKQGPWFMYICSLVWTNGLQTYSWGTSRVLSSSFSFLDGLLEHIGTTKATVFWTVWSPMQDVNRTSG